MTARRSGIARDNAGAQAGQAGDDVVLQLAGAEVDRAVRDHRDVVAELCEEGVDLRDEPQGRRHCLLGRLRRRLIPHPTVSGLPHTLKGIARYGANEYRWDYGDGTPAMAWTAIANAVAALTGKRVRRLPITADALRTA